jgi:diguanylate cyclase (GGDEF)-like protein
VAPRPEDEPAGGGLAWLARDLGLRVDAECAVLALHDGPGSVFEIASTWGARPDRPASLGPDEGRLIREISTARDVIVRPAAGAGIRHVAGAPVRTHGGREGALCLGFARPLGRDQELLEWLLESYARLAALCVHDETVLSALRAADRRDGLTGCLTDAAIRYELAREISRSARHRTPVSCAFIDLDRFKEVNTRYGHLHGSRVLSEIAATLRRSLRASDSLGRFGGDEFIAVLPETGERDAAELAARLQEAIRWAMPNGSGDPIDASIGVAQWQAGSSTEELLEAADIALRTVKADGGGYVLRASELGDLSTQRPDWRRI